jgi:E3 ubiquitin-protein ligase ZNF598
MASTGESVPDSLPSSGPNRGRGGSHFRGRGRGRGRGSANFGAQSNNTRSQRQRGRGGSSSTPASSANDQPQPSASVLLPQNNLPAAQPQFTKNVSNDNEEADPEAEVCFICASPVVHHSVAPCNHRTCHICALRMRALYKNKECAHCRVRSDHSTAKIVLS